MPAQAERVQTLAMHGESQYSKAFDHLSYVNPNAPKGGVLKMSVNGSFNSLNNHIITGDAAAGLEMINDKLMQRVWDEPFTLTGLVAESVEISDDRSALTFHLNHKARFHDGRPITADDVLFTFEFYKKNGHPVRRRVYGYVTEYYKIDDHTVFFQFGEGYDRESALILAIMPVLPRHYWDGKDLTQTTLDIPLGSGPYKIKSFDAGKRIIYERVADYWAKDLPVNRGLYNFDQIDYQYFRDDAVAFEAFKAGAYDLRREYDLAKWKAEYNFKALASGEIIKEEIKHGRPEWARGFIMNLRRPLFQDRRVRHAFILAFDFAWMNKNLFHGAYQWGDSYFANSILQPKGLPNQAELAYLNPWRDHLPEEVFGMAYEPWMTDGSGLQAMRPLLKKADQLLKEAGYTVNQKGLRVDPVRRAPVRFEILLNDAKDEKIALEYARSLRRLGIVANIRTVDTAQFSGRLDAFDFDMVSHRWINSLSPGSEQVNYFGLEAASRRGSRNYSGVQSKAVDHLARSIADAQTYDDLKARIGALDRVLTYEYLMVPLFYSGHDYLAYKKDIKRPEKTPIYGIVLESFWSEKSIP